MSQLERLKEQRESRKKKPNGAGGPVNRPVAYHPNEKARDQLRGGAIPLPDALDTISGYILGGCKLVVGYAQATNSYYAILRDDTEDWQTATAVSAFHAEPEKLLRTLAYYLLHVNPRFPEKAEGMTDMFDNW